MEVKDKVCIITGSAQGLGKAFAKILLHNGAKVCLSDMKEDALKTTFNEFVDFYGNGNVYFVQCDVTKDSDFNNLFDEAERFFNVNCIDMLVNNAGIGMHLGWRKCLDVNIVGLMSGCEIALHRMKAASKSGTVVNISSMSGVIARGGEDVMGYTVSKHANIALTKTLADDISNHGISFKVLCPAWADTELVSTLKATLRRERLPDLEKQIQKVGGLMTPEFVAKGFYKLVTECKNGTVLWVMKDTPYIIMPNDALPKVLLGVGIARLIGRFSETDLITPLHQILFILIFFFVVIFFFCCLI